MGFGQYWTSLCLASSSVPSQPCIQFLFVSSRVCVRLPSDSTSPWTPLSFANSSYCQACSGLSPPSCCACWAHYKENPFLRKAFLSTSTCFRIGIKIITQPTNTTIPPTKMDFAVKQRGR